MCVAPGAAAQPGATVAAAKAIAAHRGAASALVALLQRIIGRYVALRGGATLQEVPNPLVHRLDEDPAQFSHPMATMDGAVEVLHCCAAALLNFSTLRVNQLVLARRGVETVLGAQALMASLAAHEGASFGALERRAAQCLVAAAHNMAQHPQNRTRFYKAELRGALRLQRALLGMEEDVAADAPAATLPAQRGRSCSRSRWQSSSPTCEQRAQSAGLAAAVRSASVGPGSVAYAMQAKRRAVVSGDAALHRSLDSSLIQAVRPKAAFPAILKEPAGPPRPEADARQISKSPSRGRSFSRIDSVAAEAPGADADDAALVEPTAKALFAAWLEGSFTDEFGPEVAADTGSQSMREHGSGAPTAHRASATAVAAAAALMHDERMGFPLLNAALRRPANAMWSALPADLTARGHARWRPPISEYRQALLDAPLSTAAARLLSVSMPAIAAPGGDLAAAAHELRSSGRLSPNAAVLQLRPGTAERRGGREALTVLQAPPTEAAPMVTDGQPGEAEQVCPFAAVCLHRQGGHTWEQHLLLITRGFCLNAV